MYDNHYGQEGQRGGRREFKELELGEICSRRDLERSLGNPAMLAAMSMHVKGQDCS